MSGRGHHPGISERVYKTLLVAYPKGFREEYGPHMAQAFRDLLRDEVARRGAIGLVALWGRTILDLFVSAFAERGRTVVPVLSSRRLVRLGGISAMVGGALSLVLALLLAPGPSLVRFRAETPLFDGALELAGVVGSLLIAVGALGLYAAVVRRSPRLATLGAILASLSAVVAAGTVLYQVLFTLLSGGYPEDVMTPFLVTVVAGAVNFVGFLLLGIVVFKARTLGRWSALPLALLVLPLASPILFFLFTEGPAGTIGTITGIRLLIQVVYTSPAVLGSLGWVLLGYLLWSGRVGNPDGSGRVA